MTVTSQSSSPEQPGVRLPTRVIVSLRAGAVLAIANIICVVILAWAYTHVKAEQKVISVTGSAKKSIRSDLVTWSAKVFTNQPDLPLGYAKIKADLDRTVAYLKQQGVKDQEIKLSPIWTKRNMGRDEKGNATDKVTSYDFYGTIEIGSTDVDRITAVASKSSVLLQEGILLESDPPKYLYTALGDLKITMLADATKDATIRAQQIAANSGAKLGSIREARMGVMQINPIHSNQVSDYGNNDTSSIEKEITAVVSARFELK